MTGIGAIRGQRSASRGMVWTGFMALAALAALLFLDGRLGPVSFLIRRAAALTVLVVLAMGRMGMRPMTEPETPGGGSGPPSSGDVPDGAAHPQGHGERSGLSGYLRWRIAGWAAVIAAMAIVARAPSVPVALVGFIIAQAAIEIGAGWESSRIRLAAGLIPACLSYLAARFVVDLVPQAGWIAEAVARGGSRYVNAARGPNVDLSLTALGGPAAGLAGLYLLWSGRRTGGIGRVVAAVFIPLAWFALLPIVTPEVAAGPVAAFTRGAYHGLFWLAVAGMVGTLGRRIPPGSRTSIGDGTHTSPTRQRVNSGVSIDPLAGASGSYLPGAIAGVVAALAGVCLVGTAYVGPAAGRSVRVYNRGGLDWERPVFGQFGAFSGGMFGLLPVYCRAEGYDFDVIEPGGKVAAARAESNGIAPAIPREGEPPGEPASREGEPPGEPASGKSS